MIAKLALVVLIMLSVGGVLGYLLAPTNEGFVEIVRVAESDKAGRPALDDICEELTEYEFAFIVTAGHRSHIEAPRKDAIRALSAVDFAAHRDGIQILSEGPDGKGAADLMSN